MKFIVGYKQEMTQRYREDGTVVPVTVVKAEPAVVTQVKSAEKEGYNAVQLGIGKKKRAKKSETGHLKPILDAGKQPFSQLREIRVDDAGAFDVGSTITVQTFEEGDKISVTGMTKGKGFQGVIKRHGFSGSPKTHGHKDQLRMPGAIGDQDPQRVFKGKKMGGRTGSNQVTVKNLEIVAVDEANNTLFVKGAVPGARNGMVVLFGDGELTMGPNLFEETASASEESAETAGQEETPAEEATQQEEDKPESEETSADEAQSESASEEATPEASEETPESTEETAEQKEASSGQADEAAETKQESQSETESTEEEKTS